MAKCQSCNRELPLSGKCPICQKTGLSGFSLKSLLQKKPDGTEADGGVQTQQPSVQATPQPVSQPTLPPVEVFTPLPTLQPLHPPVSQPASTAFPQPVEAFELPIFPQARPNISSAVPPAPPPASAIPEKKPAAPVAPSHDSAEAPEGSILAGLRSKGPISSGSLGKSNAAFSSLPARNSPGGPVQPSNQLSTLKEKPAGGSLGMKDPLEDSKMKSPSDAYSSTVTGYGDEEMECAVLSGLLNDNFILEASSSKGLAPELFSAKYSRALCRAVIALREENREGSLIDRIVIKNKLKQQGIFDLPMQNFLNRVISQPAPTLDQVLHYLELLKDQALKRKLKEISENISSYISNGESQEATNLENFTRGVIEEIRSVQKAKATKRINLVKDEMRDIIREIDNREVTGEVEIIGYTFEPFHYLNVALSGFRRGFMYAIAGAPRRGKTTFTLELATAVASNCKVPVLFFTYEQTKKNLTYRLLAKESRLNPDSLQRKKVRSDIIMDAKFMGGWKKMQSYMDYFYIIEATKAETVDRIRSYAYNVMQDFNTNDIMIFVDYIQKMPLSRTYTDEKFKVEELSTELKALSIELNNPLMAISSLNKEGCLIDATESVERPTLYHCKGSGDLEYDLDCAMIQAKDWGDTKELYQQLVHKAEEMGKDSTRVPKVDVVNLYLDKNRDAPEGIYSTLQYLFFIEDNKFIELGPKYEDDRFRFSKIENLITELIEKNYIIFYDREKDSSYKKGRVEIKLKNV